MAETSPNPWPPAPPDNGDTKISRPHPLAIYGKAALAMALTAWACAVGSWNSPPLLWSGLVKAGFLLEWFVGSLVALVFGILGRKSTTGKWGIAAALLSLAAFGLLMEAYAMARVDT